MKRFFPSLLVFMLLLTSSLSSQTIEFEDVSTITAKPIVVETKVEGPITSISFESTTFNFGEIVQGEKIQTVLYFTNSGTEPLVIVNAKGSCGCTVPRWPREPILPGEKASVLVQFNSKNKKGNQSKRVTLTANTDPANSYLTLKGKVILPDEDSQIIAEVKTEATVRTKDFDVDVSGIKVYPNPAQKELKIELNEFLGQSVQIDLFNNLGQHMETRTIKEITEIPILFDVSEYETGTYTVSIKLEGKNRVAKQFFIID